MNLFRQPKPELDPDVLRAAAQDVRQGTVVYLHSAPGFSSVVLEPMLDGRTLCRRMVRRPYKPNPMWLALQPALGSWVCDPDIGWSHRTDRSPRFAAPREAYAQTLEALADGEPDLLAEFWKWANGERKWPQELPDDLPDGFEVLS